MKSLIPLTLIVFLAFGCKKSNENNTQDTVSGKFALTSLSSNLKSVKTTESNSSADFVLDTVKSSRSFYFILGNSGQEDITNVTLTTDNSNFNVTPSTITILPGTKSTNSSTVTQVISLDVVHGTRINGVGYTGLLNMGNNTCYLTITGQTSDGTNTINLTLKAKIQVFAKVMDIALYQNGKAFDLTKPVGSDIGVLGVGSMPYFYYQNTPGVIVKNTGNTAINLSLINADANNTLLQESILNTNDALTLKLPVGINTTSIAYLKLDSQGTICNQQKMTIGTDGDGYLCLINSGTYTPPIDSTQIFKVKRTK